MAPSDTGTERIPDNWYRRSVDYTMSAASPYFAYMVQQFRQNFIPGGNMGGTNSLVPMDLDELTYGVYTNDSLFEEITWRVSSFRSALSARWTD